MGRTLRIMWIGVLAGALGAGMARAGGMPDSVTYRVQWVRNTRVHVVTVDLNDHSLQVTPVLAYGSAGHAQSFTSFLRYYEPYAMMTGSYFDIASSQPIGDVVINGERQYYGQAGSALAITAGNDAQIVDLNYGQKRAWNGYESVLQGGARLVEGGAYAVNPWDQGFRDSSVYSPSKRDAVGITADHHLLMVVITDKIYLGDLARIMMDLGAVNAMNLDGGTSQGLAWSGDMIVWPGRPLVTVLMVRARPGGDRGGSIGVSPSRVAAEGRIAGSSVMGQAVNTLVMRRGFGENRPPQGAGDVSLTQDWAVMPEAGVMGEAVEMRAHGRRWPGDGRRMVNGQW